jgi:hypothetical protein
MQVSVPKISTSQQSLKESGVLFVRENDLLGGLNTAASKLTQEYPEP